MNIGADRLWVMYRWGSANHIITFGKKMITDILIKTFSRGYKMSPPQAGVILTAWHSCIANGFDPDRDYPEYSRK